MPDHTCAVDGCDQKPQGRFCKMHYARWKRTGDPGPAGRKNFPAPAECTVEGCGVTPKAKGLCVKHLSRLVRHGDVEANPRPVRGQRECEVIGCDRPYSAQGYCKRHYDRLYGELNKERIAEQRRAKHQRNRDEYLKQRREYVQQNRETVRAQRAAYYQRNQDEIRQRAATYREQNPGRERETRLKVKHGMRPEDWDALWAEQDGCCYLCGDELDPGLGRQVHIEHDHSCCPQIKSCWICRRGLACKRCNSIVGLADDDPAKLRRLADALEAAQLLVEQRKAAAASELTGF